MRIVKPSVTLLENTNNVTHVARCARICRAGKFHSEEKDQKLFDDLIASEHLSMLRHATCYYAIPCEQINRGGSDLNTFYNDFYYSPFIAHEFDKESQMYLFSTNMQFLHEHPDVEDLIACYLISEEEFKSYCQSKDLVRFSFQVITQISTSRELNRVSPNNIVEESTRYCNYSKDKFGNEVTICQPWWFDLFNDILKDNKELIYKIGGIIIDENKHDYIINNLNIRTNNYISFNIRHYLDIMDDQCNNYLQLLAYRLQSQDARGVLPLDTATKCIYTYTAAEWKHILDLRYYGTTGVPHPNAKIIAGMIREQLYNLGYTELHE